MKFLDWCRPGMGIKRWLLVGIAGIVTVSIGLNQFIESPDSLYRVFYFVSGTSLVILGGIIIYTALRYGLGTLIRAISDSRNMAGGLEGDKLRNLIYEKRVLVKGPKIVVIGGGTGLSVMLRGLKHYTSNITAVVTTADDGGGSGVLRQEMGILPPGDIRNCIVALANVEPVMEQLLQYRFHEGTLSGQSFGNLLIAAMSDISNGFEEAIQQISNVLAVTGRVLPVTLDDVFLTGELEDGTVIKGESQIPVVQVQRKSKIKKVTIHPSDCSALPDVLEAIEEADAVIIGPGSLYTSISPNLLVKGVADAIRRSNAIKIYVANIMTQPGETQGYAVHDHIHAIRQHGGEGLIDYVLVNNNMRIPRPLRQKYLEEGAEPVNYDKETIERFGIKLIEKDLLKVTPDHIRHGSNRLADAIVKLVCDICLSQDRKRWVDFYYINELMKRNRTH